MESTSKMSGEDRRAAILDAARRVFVERGFYRTTTRELALAAGVSEALLFKHFPSKEAIYLAIQESFFRDEGAKLGERLDSLAPSTASLIFLVRDLVEHVLSEQPDEDSRLFLRLILRSLMDEGEFTRMAIQGGPMRWVAKVEECIKAAGRTGDLLVPSVPPGLAGWLVHQLVSGILVHMLPREDVVDYGVSRGELVEQVVRFCLRGMGLKEEAMRRCEPTL